MISKLTTIIRDDRILEPKFKILEGKKFIGKRIRMSFSDKKTQLLWQSFMPRRREIRNNTGSELYSIEVYEPLFFNNFDPSREFEKWAAIEVSEYEDIPAEMETLAIPGGVYAVFQYKGPASKGQEAYQYIFGSWLPSSDFILDNRPHFAIMGEKYKNEDPESEEEIWIPVKPKNNSGFHLT